MIARFRMCCVATGMLAVAVSHFLSSTGRAATDLTITGAGQAQGLSVSLFAYDFPTAADEANGDVGPLGIAFPTTGGVLVTDGPGDIRLLPSDTDGQDAAASPVLAF